METLDKCFENVCELDLIFHMDKVGATIFGTDIKSDNKMTTKVDMSLNFFVVIPIETFLCASGPLHLG